MSAWPLRSPRLFWRLYLAGLTLLGLVFVANVIVGTLLSRGTAAIRAGSSRCSPTRSAA